MNTRYDLEASLRFAAFAAVVLTFLACGRAGALRPIDDGTSIERQISDHFSAKGLENELIKTAQPGDSAIIFPFAARAGAPEFVVVLDTSTSARNKETMEQVEQVVLLVLRSDVEIPIERRGAILQLLNTHHIKTWGGCFTIDDETGELFGWWAINLSKNYDTPVDTIEDIMVRLVANWYELQPKIAKGLAEPLERLRAARSGEVTGPSSSQPNADTTPSATLTSPASTSE